jgi:hypothetical protein
MTMMHIGIVWMGMHQPRVLMPMGMRLVSRIVRSMPMLMMRVMHMPVFVNVWLVFMLVLVRLGKVQIDADGHQRCRRE